ncbi:MAG: SdpI family protein [Myxococcales bacterium]|nr:SdpI family protein [Myxococcales bacterium]MCB9641948.1 SdpI family protein [Myxococcales bacterium]
MKRALGFSLVITLVGVALSWYYWAALPARFPIHWNIAGNPDNFAPKWVGAILLPLVGLGVSLLISLLVHFDPRKENIGASWKGLTIIILTMNAFLLAIHVLSLRAAMTSNMKLSTNIMMFLMGALVLGLGAAMPMMRSNFFAGIRTPWTLSSDFVWEKTHRLAGLMMGIAGAAILVLGLFLRGQTGFIISIILVLASALFPVVYSYFLFRQELQRASK